MKFNVLLEYRNAPAYSAALIANSEQSAESIVRRWAKEDGWNKSPKKVIVRHFEMKQELETA